MPNHIIKIAISGKMCAGKTTTAKALGELFNDAGFIVEHVSLATPLKEVATMLWPDRVKAKDRKMYTDLGAALLGIEPHLFGRLLQERVDERINDWEHYYNSHYGQPKNIVFIVDDLRLRYEAQYMKEHGWYLFRVICNTATQRQRFRMLYNREMTIGERTHHTETALDEFAGWEEAVSTNTSIPYNVANILWRHVRRKEPWMMTSG